MNQAFVILMMIDIVDSTKTTEQLQLDEEGTLEIKMRFGTSAPKSSELFSHFFLFPLLDDGDGIDDGDPSTITGLDAPSF